MYLFLMFLHCSFGRGTVFIQGKMFILYIFMFIICLFNHIHLIFIWMKNWMWHPSKVHYWCISLQFYSNKLTKVGYVLFAIIYPLLTGIDFSMEICLRAYCLFVYGCKCISFVTWSVRHGKCWLLSCSFLGFKGARLN